MSSAMQICLRIASTLVILTFLFAIYWMFNAYDWNYPLHKLACFSALFLSVVGFQLIRSRGRASSAALWVEIGVLVCLLITVVTVNLTRYGGTAFDRPISDIGYTTIHAAELVGEGKNPYSRTDVTPRPDIDAGYHGFHYGPGVILGFLPSAWLSVAGYRVLNIIYFGISITLLLLLIRAPDESFPERLSNIFFVILAYVMAERFWIELLPEGANDLFHIMLILAALLAVKRGSVLWAGIFLGLSCSGKFAPGLFLLPFMPLRERAFWIGLAAGLTPLVPFLIWDPVGLWRNAFWLRVVIPADWTSLYWVTPHQYHWIFGAINVVAYVAALIRGAGRRHDFKFVLVGFTLLLIVADVTQKQVHGNHLIWFYPLFAMLFMEYRGRLYGLVLPSRRVEA